MTLNRQALHAAVLGFEHPLSGEIMRFESEVPDDMACVLRVLKGCAG
jgi:23S rRNA pseudouridine1911/1915/1917 synthase